jgi:hypothetical protein
VSRAVPRAGTLASDRWTRAATLLLIALGILSGVLAAISLFQGGIGWDSPIDVGAAIQVRALPDGLSKNDAYLLVYSTSEFYGILTPQIADGLHTLFTGSTDLLQPWELSTYRWQGGVNIVFAITGAAVLGCAVAAALRSSLAGAFVWAGLMTTPLYVGMSHVDFKDMPVAAGITMLSSGLIFSRSASSPRARLLLGSGLAVIGSCVALGTRPGAWPLVTALTAGTLVMFAIADIRIRQPRRLLAPACAIVSGGVSALIFLWLTNPFARIDMPRWLFDTFNVMRGFAWDGVIRTNGQDLPATDLPSWYLPGWLLAQLPLLTIVILGWAAVAGVAGLVGVRWSATRPELLRITPLLLQGLIIPVGIVASGSVIYDGLRHVLFMIPALMGLAVIGIVALERIDWTVRGLGPRLASSLALAVVVLGFWAVARWSPYAYAYINPVAGWDKSQRNWELDYWGVSALEGVTRLREAGLAPIAVLPTQITSSLVGSVGPDVASQIGEDRYGLYVFNRVGASLGDCTQTFTIERDGQILGEGGRCP